MAFPRDIKIQSRDNPLLFVATSTGEDVVLDTDGDTENQYWTQDGRWYEEANGYLLINKATGKALKATERKEMCALVEFDPETRDDTLLWSMGDDEGDGFHAIYPTFDPDHHLDAQKGDDDISQDGTPVVTFDTRNQSNQHWKLLLPEEVEQFRTDYENYQQATEDLKENKKHSKYAGIGAGLAGAWALYEWHQMKADPENARRHQITAAVVGSVAGAAGGYAAYNAYESHENKEDLEEYQEKYTREEDEKKGWF